MASFISFFFFFNDTATTEIYTLSLHDALPISSSAAQRTRCRCGPIPWPPPSSPGRTRCPDSEDRKSTRLNSSHSQISYAVFCLKKKKKHMHLLPHLSSLSRSTPYRSHFPTQLR